MSFDLYFAGVQNMSAEQAMLDRGCCRLYSQLRDRQRGQLWLDHAKENPGTKVFVDSGAFSAWSRGKEIDVDEYINYVNTNTNELTLFASVDNIPGELTRTPTLKEKQQSPILSWENYLYMRERVKDKDKLLPVFHIGEDFKYLNNICNVILDGKHIPYIALGGTVGIKVTQNVNPFPVDGLVITYDDTQFASTGSVTGHHATRAGFAFKWQDEHADTTLDHIEWSCAASTITPVAIFEPVELEGTTVRRASLCNISECERLGIGGKGTKLQVIKANKIIPKIIKITESIGVLEIPKTCPVCDAPAHIIESESGTKTLHCSNPDCTAKQLKKFTRFVSKDGLDIDGISEQTVSTFINEGWIKEYADFYHLKDFAHQIITLEGFGRKSVHNLLESIEKSRQTDARHFLFALNIPLCGGDVCKRLLGRYHLNQLIETARTSLFDDEFACIDGIGPEKSARFIEWFHNDKNFERVTHLLKELTIQEEEKGETGTKCEGQTFVITGDVHHYKNRNELKAYIESQGGKVTGSVSKSTTYLINNDAESQSTKNKKAHQLGIAIITEEQFMQQFT